MKCALALLLIVVVTPPAANAAFTDFSDLTFNDKFYLGQTIHSQDLSFEVVGFLVDDVSVIVGGDSSGNPKIGFGGMGLDFQLALGVQAISFLYDIDSDDNGMVINGVGTSLTDTFTDLDGLTVGGVLITITPRTQFPQEEGMVFLAGPINSFIVGGLELSIDDVTVRVPEASSLLIMILAASSLFIRHL